MRCRWVAPLRLCGVVVVLCAISLALGLASILELAGPRDGLLPRRLRRSVLGWGSRALLTLLAVEVRALGKPPSGAFVLVSNHLSYLDVVVLASRAPCIFVAKSEVRAWPLLGPLVRAFGTVFLDRERKVDLPLALAAMDEVLRRGEGVVLFPEGTTSDGSAVAPFRSSLLALAARRGLPVYTAALGYATAKGEPPASEAVCWWGESDFLPHLARLATLSRVEATVRFGPVPVRAGDRKLLAARLEEEVRELAFPGGGSTSLASLAPSTPLTARHALARR